MKEDRTIAYYDDHAQRFTWDTLHVAFTDIQDRFLAQLQPGSLILDFGCGAGRDSRYFLQKGYRVEACDGSAEMVRTASENTGLPVRQMLFSELDETARYDGIFACASILHVPSSDLPEIFRRISRALKPGGIAYISFKYGDFEGIRNERYFTDLREETLGKLLQDAGGLRIIDQWITGDVRPGRQEEKWLNALLRRYR